MQNMKSVYRILLETLLDETETINGGNLKTLEGIAYQCVLSGGDAVLMARSLLASTGTYTYDDVVLCANAGVRDEEELLADKGLLDFTVFPNPAQDMIQVRIVNSIDKDMEISIYNSVGKLVKTDNLTGMTYQKSIHIEDLVEGIYFVKLETNGNPRGVEKIVLLR